MWNEVHGQTVSSPQTTLPNNPNTTSLDLISSPSTTPVPTHLDPSSSSTSPPNQLQLDQNQNQTHSPDDLPVVPSPIENNYFKQSTTTPTTTNNNNNNTTTTTTTNDVPILTRSQTNFNHNTSQTNEKSPSDNSSNHSHSTSLHPLLKQTDPLQTNPSTGLTHPFETHPHLNTSTSTNNNIDAIKHNQQQNSAGQDSPGSAIKFKTRSQGGRPKDAVWVYFHTNGNGTDERATCKYCGWHVERPKAFRMRDHVAQCTAIDPVRRAEMSQLIAIKEAAAVAKQEEKAQLAAHANASTIDSSDPGPGSATKRKKVDHPIIARPVFSSAKSPVTCHVLDATSGKPGNEMGIRLDRLTSNGFVLIANGTTDGDGRCNNLLPIGSKPEIGIYKVTFFSNEFYQKRGIVSFYPFVEITFEVKDPTEHYHVPLLLSPYSFSTYRGS